MLNTNTNKNVLYDRTSNTNVMAGLLQNPALLYDTEKYTLTPEDFPSGVHRIIFSAIANMVREDFKVITAKDVDLYIGQYNKAYTTYQSQKGFDFVQELENISLEFDNDKFDYYYSRLKKFTLLRDYENAGINTKEFYNPDADFLKLEKESQKLNDMQIDAIIDGVRERINHVEDKYVSKNRQTSQDVAVGLDALFEELKRNPEIGLPIDGDITNYAVRGARYGKLYILSAPSGHGKTRKMVGNACALAFPRIEGDQVIYRKNLTRILFVATEMQPDEIQTLTIAYVSGVSEDKLLYNTYNEKEEELIRLAIEIIKEYKDNFIIEYIPDPSLNLVRTKLVKHILHNQTHHIFYDYIFTSPGLITEYRGAGLREDVVLMMLANTLKEVASEFNVFIFSATQLNGEWQKNFVRNVNHIRGSKAIVDKVDIGMIMVKLNEVPEELEGIKTMIGGADLPADTLVPNMVIDLYKNRRGQHAGIKIYLYFDHSTCRTYDICMTTTNQNIIKTYDNIGYETHTRDLLDLITEKVRKGKI